jgi:hypothetical protein
MKKTYATFKWVASLYACVANNPAIPSKFQIAQTMSMSCYFQLTHKSHEPVGVL